LWRAASFATSAPIPEEEPVTMITLRSLFAMVKLLVQAVGETFDNYDSPSSGVATAGLVGYQTSGAGRLARPGPH
jgi:hypothetical protein